MTQDAIVTKTLPENMAEVVVSRTTACGSNCGNCESCIFQNEIKTLAHNLIGARAGQKVIIESRSSVIYGAAFFVYIMPIIFFFIGYALAYSMGLSEGLCVAVSFLTLILSTAFIVYSERRKKKEDKLVIEIVDFAKGTEGI